MQAQKPAEEQDENAQISDVPATRQYDDGELVALDDALVNAIEKARAADEDFIAELLENQVKSLYYGNQ